MGYSGVYVFGDSLVDSGNALKLAEVYDYFPFTDLPDGAPTSGKGYHSGNFTNGWTFADLISNKYVSVPTKTVFPFGYDEPFLGISFGFISDPDGNNLNFAYGGAQIRQGDEAVPDMDDQTDAYRDAVDGDADPNALHLFVFGANDVHDLVPRSGAWASLAEAQSTLQRAADEYIEEVQQTIEIGAGHILLLGVPDIGIQPYYNGSADEAARRAAATEYAQMLDDMIRAQLDQLTIPGVELHYAGFAELAESVLGTMVDLYGMGEIYPLNLSNEVFFDRIHPTAQVHALAAAQMIDLINGAAGERMPLTAPDYSSVGSISVKGEVDTITVSLAANTGYTIDLLGLSTLGGNISVLADPMLKLFGPAGILLGSNDDGGIGLDSSFTFTSGAAGDYTIQLSGVGSMTGSYLIQASGQAAGDNSYAVSHAGAIILEHVGGGFDTVSAGVNYALNVNAEVEVLRSSNDKSKTAINLTGNDFAQTIVGNGGNNIIEGKGGADVMTGGSGKDIFVLSMAAVTSPGAANIDRITDYGSGDIVDLSQILSVAAGTNVVGGQYARVTTSGLIQVDVDGGGNNWVTLSQINNGGAVTVRYLSGGVATNLSLSRVEATSNIALASAVAAAGMMAEAAVAEPAAHDSGALTLAGITSAKGMDLRIVDRGEETGLVSFTGDAQPAANGTGLSGGHHSVRAADAPNQHWLTGAEPPSMRSSDESAGAIHAPVSGDETARSSMTANAVSMPSADMLLAAMDQAAPDLSELVADVLADGRGVVDGLLAALPGNGSLAWLASDSPAANEMTAWPGADVLTLASAQFAIEALMSHPDAGQPV